MMLYSLDMTIIIILQIMKYHIAGKFGREKFGKLTLRAFGERKFGELIDQPIDY